ncbi:MAG: hypothetical protein MPEBLZ_02937 [Candidatus Methanoperedens nitroreducens]|uniref:Uncharacterized protein n=1 Tax=Candidatus Methanoperedens nitratireducens TaxID=1392998 RepID=A0A0P8A7A0_9EURY|nr:hypothetical protein [Candidatus Methanoperedens sp. BLZ2]KAB2944896.1 MAG: hypothetical protein F9K14_12715 [Candidatus Methanoperedens sp.]KPQ42479.1 MAG: hypothetical protein MPEBLZ_02937 [Candidatus Methanoperedens sp. BLZ1]MBZ0173771.1 hypothetical protein [Candidatus Methanoperedens nitroreducens]CAG0992629.1 hypothetical protein METP2_02713 [Methanosarcinales archaeon]MCX9078272.1 hypothetical protein [Candidatus Methanoperedens sp.]
MIVDFREQVSKQVIEEVRNRKYLKKINDLSYGIFLVSLLSLLFSGILFVSGIDLYNGLLWFSVSLFFSSIVVWTMLGIFVYVKIIHKGNNLL